MTPRRQGLFIASVTFWELRWIVEATPPAPFLLGWRASQGGVFHVDFEPPVDATVGPNEPVLFSEDGRSQAVSRS